ncbi:MAG: FHA domain-containing protein [Lachnospiraceae bacterium]|nr:FHA domain-containing protein [Lachnospiraceae bacterium]
MRRVIALFSVFIILGTSIQASAAVKCSLLQLLADEDEIVAYIESDDNVDSVNAQVSKYPCENVAIVPAETISIHSIILLDNSLSITETNREKIKNILKQYVQRMPENEVVSLAVFGEEIQFLAERSNDVNEMVQLVDAIEFQNQDTYLTDYLFQLLDKIEKDLEFTRFVVISDGVDNKAIGITKEELTSKLREISRPIYTIGHIYKENIDELKNMFALSRATGGKELLIEDFEDIDTIEEEIHDFSKIYGVKMTIPSNVMDGEQRNVLFEIHTNDGNIELTGTVSMPFGLIEETESTIESETETESESEPESIPMSEPESIPEPEPIPEPEENTIDAKTIVGVVILVAAGVALIVYQAKRKKEKNNSRTANKHKEKNIDIKEAEEENETTILAGRYLLILRDMSDPERIFRYPMDGRVVVGRNVDMVQIAIDYNLTISGRHCEFYIKNNRFFVRDLDSANHTYLEGKMVKGEMEIVSGNTVRLGEVEFGVEIMPI